MTLGSVAPLKIKKIIKQRKNSSYPITSLEHCVPRMGTDVSQHLQKQNGRQSPNPNPNPEGLAAEWECLKRLGLPPAVVCTLWQESPFYYSRLRRKMVKFSMLVCGKRLRSLRSLLHHWVAIGLTTHQVNPTRKELRVAHLTHCKLPTLG